ncbi:hypothetical protein GCM10009547_13830 [Sporichthya brevicatena]|uniref:SCP domain-containing protein n=1 Tax=Sporichthya brevicatena TaxID=171442 RepID=A0ABN1GK59_9ACTN
MTHAHAELPVDSKPAGSLLGDLARFVGLVTLTLALVVGALIGLGGTSQAAPKSNASVNSASVKVLRSSVIHLTNVARKSHGCRPLKQNSKLQKAAQRHANDMSKKRYFAHNSANGTVWWKRIMKAGYKDPGGENIARGFSSTAAVVKAWLNSPSHRKNIMNCQFRTIGIGFNTNGDYWVQDFGY